MINTQYIGFFLQVLRHCGGVVGQRYIPKEPPWLFSESSEAYLLVTANLQSGNVPCKFSTNVFCIIRSMLAHSHLTVYGVMCVFGTAYFLLRRQHENH